MKIRSKMLLFMVLYSTFQSFTVQAQINQTKPTLTILPYTGATGGEEEAITSLLSRQEDLHKIFTMVPCTSTFNDIAGDIESGTYVREADIIAELKSRLNADFAVIVWAEKVGTGNLTLLSLVHVGTLRQLAGDYRKYTGVRDIRTALPDIAKKIIDATRFRAPDLPKFTVLPFYSAANVRKDANILFQLLNIELANSGKYAVFPWALIIDTLIHDRNIPYYYGIVDPQSINEFGQSSNVQYVLTGDLLNQGTANLFMTSIINTKKADFLAGGDIEYKTITDDLDGIAKLSKALIRGGEESFAEERAPAAVTPGVANPPEQNPVIAAFPEPPPPRINPAPAPGTPVQNPAKPALTILPFSGATGGDEEIMTIMLANQEYLRDTFNVVPCTTNFNRLIRDIESKTYTSKEDIFAEVRNRLNVDFALIVRAENVGNGNIMLVSLVHVPTLRQLSGKYQIYAAVRDIRAALSDIAREIVVTTRLTTDQTLPKLTVLPFYTPSGVDVRDADILFQFLTIELANSGNYVVYPWALPIETLISDLEIPYFGIIDPKSINAFGSATNIPYILTGDLLNLGTTNLFLTAIVKAEDAGVLSGGDIEYRNLMEDMGLLTDLSNTLVNGKNGAGGNDPWALANAASSSQPPRSGMPPLPIPSTPPTVGYAETDPLKNFVKIPGGAFTMGTPLTEAGRDGDEIQHEVQVPGFYLGKYEVTQEEYEAVMGADANPSSFKRLNLPVEQITWFEAITYCNARSVKEGLTPVYTINGEQVTWNQQANGYRLPTEAEWEYACRAGTATTFNTGNNFSSSDGNYDGTYSYNNNPTGLYRERTMPVGSFNPNRWELYDMHGNVYEWCWDRYVPYNAENPNLYVTTNRIARGGSWYSAPRYLRSGNRVQFAPGVRVYYVGFRLARNLPN